MRVIGGDLPKLDGYAVTRGRLNYLFKSWGINAKTVASVSPVSTQKTTNYAGAGQGMFVGAAFLGPLGAVAGGLIGGKKIDEVLFMIQFTNGQKALCRGTNKEFETLIGSSMSGA